MAAIFKEEAVALLFRFPHEAAALTEWRDAAWPMMEDGSRVSTAPTAQLIGLWAHYVIPRERKIAHYSLQEGG